MVGIKAFLFLSTLIVAVAAVQNSGIFDEIPAKVAENPPIPDGDGLQRRDPLDSIVHVKRDTNGERFKRGEMSPLKPTKRGSALRPRASPASNCMAVSSVHGVIQVLRASDNVILGYVRRTFDGQNSYTWGALANALTVSVPVSIQNNAFTEMTALNGPDPGHPFVGAVGGAGGYNFNTGQLGYAYLSGTGHTPANSPPSFSAGHSIQALGYNAPAESTVWKINCLTGAITAQWTNVDGSQPATSIFYDPSVDFLALIGDFNKFVQTFPGEGTYLVTFTFVPVP